MALNKIMLASGSPRRLEILTMAGYDCTVLKTDADESVGDISPMECVRVLSKRKAAAASEGCTQVIVAADTVVALGDNILGKPENALAAKQMLRSLSGREHTVFTGVTVCRGDYFITECEKTIVTMREISEDEICAYVASGEPFDKAGGYGIQGAAGMFIRSICGDYYTVMGLPLCLVSGILRNSFDVYPVLKRKLT